MLYKSMKLRSFCTIATWQPRLEDIPPLPRRKSWSAGDGDPTGFGLSKVANVPQEVSKVPQEVTPTREIIEIRNDPNPKMLAKHRSGRCKPCVSG